MVSVTGCAPAPVAPSSPLAGARAANASRADAPADRSAAIHDHVTTKFRHEIATNQWVMSGAASIGEDAVR
jgi:hypothetical protein